MKQYKIGVFFEKGYLVSSQINLVTEDYKSTEFIFEFDIEEGRKVFELKKPNGSKYIKDIVNNKITLVDYDTELNEISLIPTAGTYEFEIVNYTEDSKLTLQEHGHFEVRGEIVEVNDSEVEKDTRLPILDSLINDVEGLKTDINSSVENATEQADYAKEQGDYAKEQAQIIIDANTTATKIINDFETNVSVYTRGFNTNVEEKLEAYNQNDIDKTQAYNKNAESKENSYNENASNKLKEYNDNATTKLSEYNTNSETKTKAFNTNASEKTDAFNLNVTNKTTDFDSNVEAKTTEFNDNATTKTEEYNTNAEAKVNEFNTIVDELKQDVEDCYNNMLTNEAEGTSIHVEDSANARIISLESEGNCEQVTTTGKNKLDFNALVANVDFVTKNNDGSYSVTGNGSAVSIATIDYELEAGTYYISADYTNSKDLVNSETGNLLAFNMTLEDGTSQWVSLIRTDDVAGTRRSVKFVLDKKVTRIHLQTFERFTSGTITFKNVQIGSDSEYEPYTGGQPSPSPDYPQDVEVVEAYNLFDKDNANILNAVLDTSNGKINANITTRTLYLEIPDNTDNITVSRISGERFSVGTIDVLPSVGAACLNYIGNNSAKSITIPVLRNSKYLVVYYYNETVDTLSEQEILDGIQIVKGSEVKPYMPYGCIRNKFIGKNFFNISSWSNIAVSGLPGTAVVADGTVTIENPTGTDVYTSTGMMSTGMTVQSNLRKYLIEVEPNTEYTISFDVKGTSKDKVSNNSSYYSLFNEKYESIYAASMGQFIVPTNKHSKTITTTADTKYLAVRFGAEAIAGITRIYSNIQIEKSPIPTKFEPYKENILDINLQGNFMSKIGDVADTLRVENGRAILTKRIGKFVPNSNTKIIVIASPTQENSKFYGIDNTGLKALNNSLTAVSSNIFTARTANELWLNDVKNYCSLNLSGNLHFRVDSSLTTAADVRQFLIDSNAYFIGILAEPYEVDLGEVKMPKMFEGVTNISMIANIEGNMKLKYVRSTNIVVNNLAKAIVALGGEV